MKILHITPHLGGGVGRILSSVSIYSNEDYEHIILTLEETQTVYFKNLCTENNIDILNIEKCNIDKLLRDVDIVQLEWWHHPLTMKFMIDFLQDIPTRLLLWAHISGCNYPVIPAKFIDYADEFVFTSDYSFENDSWTSKERSYIKNKAKVVVSSAIDESIRVEKKYHDKFNVGYIGFLSYTKTHPKFKDYCESTVNIPSINHIIVGDTNYGKELVNDMKKSKVLNGKFKFTGYTDDIKKYLSEFDVFGYPLNPIHYGTAENVLLESMGAGVVPVVLNQCTEKYLVKDKETGIVVNDIEEYGQAIKWLYENEDKRNELGKKASEYVLNNYHIKNTIINLNRIYDELINKNKITHNTEEIFGKTPYDWFKSCYVGDLENLEGCAIAETKGSAKHYLKYFDDENLRKVVELNESRKQT